MSEDFVLTTGDRDIVGRNDFKSWIEGFIATVDDFEFHIVETFENADGSRVASRWRITGKTADGKLLHNWVERNAYEICGLITQGKGNIF